MKKFLLFVSIAFVAAGCAGVRTDGAEGGANVESRKISLCDNVNVSSGIDLYLSQGAMSDLMIEVSDSRLLEAVKTTVDDKTLTIEYKPKNRLRDILNRRQRTISVYVTLPAVEGIKAESGAMVKLQDTVRGRRLDVAAMSGAYVKGAVDVRILSLSVSSGSVVRFVGKAQTATFDASSGATADCARLDCADVQTSASSGASVQLRASDVLRAEASSGASILCYGNPADVHQVATSGGSVRVGE